MERISLTFLAMSEDVLMVSISGLRGIVGRTLTPEVAARYAAAFGRRLRETTGKAQPLVVLGRDGRPSGPELVDAAARALASVGCRAIRLGVATTPGTAVMVLHLGADGGIVVTASHNPSQWNGMKLLRHDGVAPPPEEARRIISDFESAPPPTCADAAAVEDDDRAAVIHAQRIVEHIDVAAIRKRRFRVVIDSVNGSGGPGTAPLLEKLGVDAVRLFAAGNGQFPHPPEPTAEHLTGLCDAVREHGAAVGFAQDPDADRLALVDETGRYVGEEYTLALCAQRVLQRRPGPVATNLSTSRMVEDVAADRGCPVYRTPVGEANVAASMRAHNAVIGGEGNGGVIWPVISHIRDSLAGIALVLELMAMSGKPLSELVNAIPRYAIVKDKQPIEAGAAAAIERLRSAYSDRPIDLQDGLRIETETGWVHVRPSNTEPILRIIAEAETEPAARAMIDEIRSRMR